MDKQKRRIIELEFDENDTNITHHKTMINIRESLHVPKITASENDTEKENNLRRFENGISFKYTTKRSIF